MPNHTYSPVDVAKAFVKLFPGGARHLDPVEAFEQLRAEVPGIEINDLGAAADLLDKAATALRRAGHHAARAREEAARRNKSR
jgi:hypothetical protein